MTPTLERLAAEKAAIEKKIEQYLSRRRRGCEHKQGWRCYIGGGDGYMMMCRRCYVEEHHWAPYLMGSDTEFVDIERHEFFDKRPPGALVLLEYPEE